MLVLAPRRGHAIAQAQEAAKPMRALRSTKRCKLRKKSASSARRTKLRCRARKPRFAQLQIAIRHAEEGEIAQALQIATPSPRTLRRGR